MKFPFWVPIELTEGELVEMTDPECGIGPQLAFTVQDLVLDTLHFRPEHYPEAVQRALRARDEAERRSQRFLEDLRHAVARHPPCPLHGHDAMDIFGRCHHCNDR